MSDKGVKFIMGAEEYVATPHKDEAGISTIGYGHVILPGERFDQPLTQAEALALARRDIARVVNPGLDAVKVPLKQHQVDALGSLIFNIGDGGRKKSTLLRHVNAGDCDAAASAFADWNKDRVNGVPRVSKGLTKRRVRRSTCPSMRLQHLIALVSFAAAPLAAVRVAAQQPADTGQHDPCPNAATQTALTRCADGVARRADAALNAVYGQAIARSDGDRRTLLREAQRRWIAFRDAHCADETALYAGGSMYPMQLLLCRASLSDARRAQLQARLKDEATR